MILKSYLVEQNLEALDKYSLVLMYGENEGIKNDFKEKLGRNIKETEIINFHPSTLFLFISLHNAHVSLYVS